jgi:hypothetical protein
MFGCTISADLPNYQLKPYSVDPSLTISSGSQYLNRCVISGSERLVVFSNLDLTSTELKFL